MVPYPKEVYGWYHSAQLHTGKFAVPRAVWILLGCVVVVPLLGYLGWRSLFHSVAPQQAASGAMRVSAPGAGSTALPGAPGRSESERKPMTAAEYVASRTARLPGMPYTAPAYDKVTEPAVAPYPAMCVLHQASGKCDCYSQQATRLETPRDVCAQIARFGIFVDWRQEGSAGAPGVRAAGGSGVGGGSSPGVPAGPVSAVPGAAGVAAGPVVRAGAAAAPGVAASAPVVVSYGGEVPLGAVDDHALDLARLAQARREWEARPVASPILLLGQRP